MKQELLQQEIDKVKASDFVDNIVYTASLIFEGCLASSDFCVQSIDFDTIVFGSTNRLIFNVQDGWHASTSHCTPRFLSRWANDPYNQPRIAPAR